MTQKFARLEENEFGQTLAWIELGELEGEHCTLLKVRISDRYGLEAAMTLWKFDDSDAGQDEARSSLETLDMTDAARVIALSMDKLVGDLSVLRDGVA